MPPLALALILAAALLHALWNIAAKKTHGGASFALLSNTMLVVLWAPLALLVGGRSLLAWHGREWAVVLASGVVHGVYFATLLRGYRAADLTVVYPVARGSGPLLSSLGAIALFGERLSVPAALGLAGVVTGVILIAGGPSLWRPHPDPAARQRIRAGIAWGAATGAFICLYTLLDGYAVKTLRLDPIVLNFLTSLVTVPLLLPATWRARAELGREWRQQWRAAAAVAVLGPIGYVFVLEAMRLAPLSHVAPARELSLLFAALLGGRLLGEGDRAMRLAGAAMIGLGVVGLALG